MALRCEQIEVLLDNIKAAAWIRHRENPRDPTLARDMVAQTRALLRTVDLEHHVRICDQVQQIILGMECPGDHDGMPLSAEPAFMHAASARAWVPDLGIPLAADPFDLDAYPDDGPAPVEGAGDHGGAAPAQPRRRPDPERRVGPDCRASLRAGLTPKQLATLDTMALFGWTLEFVRRPMFRPVQPVAFDRNRQRFVVVDADGIAAEDPDVQLRG